MKSILIAVAALLSISQVMAKETPVPAEPSEHPSWALLRSKAEGHVKATLYDPSSAQISWTSGFEWGFARRPLGSRRWGWVGCLSLNAKNRLGGYVGEERYWIVFVPDRGFDWGTVTLNNSQCDTPGKVPLQPELLPLVPASNASVADELSKLSDLMTKGLITKEEFAQQKAKLLRM